MGNDALLVKNKSKPTMYLNLFGKSEADQRSLVLHEFGHALGLDHEHQRSDFWKVLERFTIGKQKMQDGDDGQCAKAVAEHFKRDYQERVAPQQTDYDPQSIMHYWYVCVCVCVCVCGEGGGGGLIHLHVEAKHLSVYDSCILGNVYSS